MSGRTLSLVGMPRAVVEFYNRSLHSICSDIRLVSQKLELKKIQDLDETNLIKEKIFQASRIFNPPLVVEDEGFYIQGLDCFPGTISEAAVKGLGWKELCCSLAKDREVRLFTQIGFLDSCEQVYVFREEVFGSLVCLDDFESKDGNVQDFFVPKGQKLTLTQMESVPEFQGLFPRYRAIEALARSKVFQLEFSRTKRTVISTSREL